ncbi:MAG: energy transducer TonB, partial [Bacteroidaceae bacterium]|nr:energy transducer TonB [Bacteroidaceae bacterium]
FVVNSDGSIQDVTVLRSSGDIHLDNEAVRVVSSMPKWNPGKQQGKAVSVRFTLPVVFRLQGAAKNNELLPPLKRAESTTTHELQSVKGRKGKINELQDELQRKDIIIKDI